MKHLPSHLLFPTWMIGCTIGLLAALAPTTSQAACVATNQVSGNWAPGNGTVLCGGTYSATTMTINSGVTLSVNAGSTVTLIAQTITVNGSVGVGGTGDAGGGGGPTTGGDPSHLGGGNGSGSGPGVGAPSYHTGNPRGGGSGGGGGGFGCDGNAGCGGGTGGVGTAGGAAGTGGASWGGTGDLANPMPFGSGGGGGSTGSSAYGVLIPGGNGGRGGGSILLWAREIKLGAAAILSANGADGETPSGNTGSSPYKGGGGGGGGSGGNIAVVAFEKMTVASTATLRALGGNGGSGTQLYSNPENRDFSGGGGGGGGGGRVKIYRPETCTSLNLLVSGGAGGNGGDGQAPGGSAGHAGSSFCGNVSSIVALNLSASAAPNPVLQGQPVTVTVNTSGTNANPGGYLLEYEFDCTGTGTAYGTRQTSPTATCTPGTVGTQAILVRASQWNTIAFTDGTPIGAVTYGTPVVLPVSVTVTSAAPQVTLNVPSTASEGQTLTMSATVVDTAANVTAGFNYSWNFGDGSVQTARGLSSLTHAFDTAGTFTVSLTVTNAGGYSTTKTATVVVAKTPPVVVIGTIPSPIYAGITSALFTATATDPSHADTLAGFTWSFQWGDMTTATSVAATASNGSVSANHTYAQAGSFTLTVTATSQNGAVGSATATVVVVNPAATVTIGTLPSPIYAGTDLSTFTASATDPLSSDTTAGFTYVFQWGDGTTATTIAPTASNTMVSATHAYGSSGSLTLTVTATGTSGITGSATVQVPVANPGTPAGPAVTVTTTPANGQVNAGTAINLSGAINDPNPPDNQHAFTYSWDFGDGSALVTGTTATPNLTSTTTSHSYASPGTFTVSLTVTDRTGRAGVGTGTVKVLDLPPVAQFTNAPLLGVEGAPVTVTASASSVIATQNSAPFRYHFDWGDGTSSDVAGTNTASTTHTYNNVASFTLTLTVYDSLNTASAPVQATAMIGDVAPTVVIVEAPNGVETTTLTFKGKASSPSTTQTDTGYTYSWSWGDGTTSSMGMNLTSPTHVYGTAGTFTVTLTATDSYGLSGSATTQVQISGIAPTVVIGSIPAPIYPSIGSATFTASATDPSAADTLAGFAWSFQWGDMTASTNTAATASNGMASASHTYTRSGTFTLTVTATSQNGAVGTGTATVVVTGPTVTVTIGSVPSPIYAGTDLSTFTASASDPLTSDGMTGFTYSFQWNDTTAVTTISPTASNFMVSTNHAYARSGTFTLTVTASGASGITGSASVPVTVLNPGTPAGPAVTIVTTPANGQITAPNQVSFAGTIADPNPPDNQHAFNFVWDFGDGSARVSGSTATPNLTTTSTTHTYSTPGTYSATLTATDRTGRSGTGTAPVQVADVPPVAQFTNAPYTGVEGTAISFSASATSVVPVESTGLFRFHFDWGDATSSDVMGLGAATTTHIYYAVGINTVTLTVYDAAQTASTPVTTTATIGDVAPSVVILRAPGGPEGSVIAFKGAASNPSPTQTAAGFSYTWNWGDSTADTTGHDLTDPTHVFTTVGTFTVKLTATDSYGLSGQATVQIQITDVPPTVTLDQNITVNRNTVVPFNPRVSTPGSNMTFTYAWSFGDTTQSTDLQPMKTYAAFGDYSVSLQVTDAYGGMTTATTTVHVKDPPPLAITVFVSPAQAFPTDTLTLSYTYTQVDNNPESGTTIAWLKNGQPVAALANLKTVASSFLQTGQVWQAQVTPGDGFTFGAPALSNQVTIGAHPPTAVDLSIQPAHPRYADTLTASYTYGSIDGTPETGTTIAWTRNNVVQPQWSNSPRVTPPLTRGDVWSVTVTPANQFLAGTPAISPSVTVGNTPPAIPTIPNIAVPANGPLTMVSWSVSTSDVDGDQVTLDCSVPGRDFGPGPAFSASFEMGLTTVTCTASDGMDTTTSTFIIGVGDVAPVVTAGPDQIVDPGLLSLTAVGSDPLNRPLSYAWQIVSSPVTVVLSNASQASTSLLALKAGDYVLQVTASNGAEMGTAQVKITVRELAPIANAGPSPITTFVGDLLTIDGSRTADPNGDALTYLWTQISGPPVQFVGTTSTEASAQITCDTAAEVVMQLSASDGTLTSKAQVTLEMGLRQPATDQPIAHVGPNQTVLVGEQVTLDGSGSYDPGGSPLQFTWSEVSGPSITFSDVSSVRPTFTPNATGSLVLQLSLSNGAHATTAQVIITVIDAAGLARPIATINPEDSTSPVNTTLTLDGSTSLDPTGGTLTYNWTQLGGPYVSLGASTEPQLSITPFLQGEYVFQLTVSNGAINSLPAIATVHMTGDVVEAPAAVATGPTQGFLNLPVTLDGSQSHDPAGRRLSMHWTQLSGPPLLVVHNTAAEATFTAATVGTYEFQLAVSNGVFTSTATVSVSVSLGLAPVARVTGPAGAYVGDTVKLDGSLSTDPAGRPLTYSWRLAGGPQATLAGVSTAAPSFVAAKNGDYELELIVSNGLLTSAPATFKVTVHHFPVLRGGCDATSGASVMGLLGLLALSRRRRTSRSA